MNPVIYIFINKGLGMSVGKIAAQAAHAAAQVNVETNWLDSAHRTILIMEARDEAHLRNIEEYLNDRSIDTRLVIDEGVNEIEAHVPTALTTSVLDKDDLHIKATFSTFKLYRDKVKVTLEVDK